MPDKSNCEPESLRTQLTELNIRARAYTSQSWQIPFAYIGILSLGITQITATEAATSTLLFLFGGLLGIAVVIHMTAMLEGTKRAVTNILSIETKLGLEQTVKYRPLWHVGPLFSVVGVAAVSCLITAGYFLCQAVHE